MLPPNFTLKDIPVGRGSIIGRDNIEEFFTHVSTVKDFEDRSLVELAPTYEIATASLVHMLEARFVNLNPIMQHMFLTLYDMEEGEKKDFVLETLLKEFGLERSFLNIRCLALIPTLLVSLKRWKKIDKSTLIKLIMRGILKHQYLASS